MTGPRLHSARQRISSTSVSGKAGEDIFIPASSLNNYEGAYQFGVFAQVIRGSVTITSTLVPIDMAKHDVTCFVSPQTIAPGNIEHITALGVCYRIQFVQDSEVYIWGI